MDNEMMQEKIEFFMQEKIPVHVKLTDKSFLNGVVDKKLKDGLYWFKDRKLDGVYLFLKDIYQVKEFTEDKGVGG